MKISYHWLKQIISTQLSPEEIGKILTGTGLEVEHIENFESIKGGLEGIIVGDVISVNKHPNADKLNICQVNLGSETKQIVCGAPNVAQGQKVLVAPVGSTVNPTKGEPFKITKAKIRGEVSEGMICAEDELSLGESHDGILVLPADYEVGKPAINYFNNYTDYCIEIGLTANRGDAASHLGVARDIYAVTGNEITLDIKDLPSPANVNNSIEVTIQNPEQCPRYSGLSISGVTVKQSPDWLQNKLKCIGLTPINNIVDATNYTMHFLGQPLHAFDADKISGKKIIVKNVQANTKFTTLDKVERTLEGFECMICDAEKPLAMAGVFGGLESGIQPNTTNIFIESAYFNAAAIRKAAKHHGLSTDASFRYERGTDPEMTINALKFVAHLILDIAGGSVSSVITDNYPNKVKPVEINFSLSKNAQIIGITIPNDEVIAILKRLDIEILNNNNDNLLLKIPSYRSDVTRPIDVTEEILRIYGLNKIPMGTDIKSATTFSEFEFGLNLKHKITNYLASNGFIEIATNSLSKPEYYTEQQIEKSVHLLNPLSKDLSILRPALLPSLLESVQYNLNRKQDNLQFFEIAKTYVRNGSSSDLKSYSETKEIGILLTGNQAPEIWNIAETPITAFDVKAKAIALLDFCRLPNITFEPNKIEGLTESMEITCNQTIIGYLGCVEPKVLKSFDIQKPVWYINLLFEPIELTLKNQKFKLKTVSAFPSVRRDLALVLDNSVQYKQIETVAFKCLPKLLTEVNAFDVYTGDKIETGKKSYAISFMLQDTSKTLTDNEIEAAMSKLLKAFEKELGATLRS